MRAPTLDPVPVGPRIEISVDCAGCSVSYKKGCHNLAVVTLPRDLRSLQVDSAKTTSGLSLAAAFDCLRESLLGAEMITCW